MAMGATESAISHRQACSIAVSVAPLIFRNMSWLSFRTFSITPRLSVCACVRVCTIFLVFFFLRSFLLVVFLCARGRPADSRASTDSSYDTWRSGVVRFAPHSSVRRARVAANDVTIWIENLMPFNSMNQLAHNFRILKGMNVKAIGGHSKIVTKQIEREWSVNRNRTSKLTTVQCVDWRRWQHWRARTPCHHTLRSTVTCTPQSFFYLAFYWFSCFCFVISLTHTKGAFSFTWNKNQNSANCQSVRFCIVFYVDSRRVNYEYCDFSICDWLLFGRLAGDTQIPNWFSSCVHMLAVTNLVLNDNSAASERRRNIERAHAHTQAIGAHFRCCCCRGGSLAVQDSALKKTTNWS